MNTTITFNQLRKIKDSLPDGSIHTIAEELNLDVETVRNYFGGKNYDRGKSVGIHMEPGPDGGIVEIDDTTILDMAKELIESSKMTH
ncbi:MAG: DNA-binding protein [Marinilabiliaceae bacterium]|nr:DNA-binding protein [Marinilabiliaceae bacterium]